MGRDGYKSIEGKEVRGRGGERERGGQKYKEQYYASTVGMVILISLADPHRRHFCLSL